MSDPALPLLDRLDRLERSNRRLGLATLALGLLVLVWAACSVAPQAENALSAERFVLVASDGSEKAALELDSKGNPLLTMKHGGTTVVLTTNGPALLLRGPDGKTGAFMGIDTRNSSKVELTSHRLMDGVRLAAHEDGSCGVYVLDPNGRQRGGLESFSTGGAALDFRDEQGRMRGQLGLDAGSLPNLVLLDEAGVRRAGMILQADGSPLLELTDERGRPRAHLATLFDGSPRLDLRREDGSSAFQAP